MAASTSLEIRLFDALKRIAAYDSPERLRRTSERDYGLDPDEAIEYAYENVISEAKHATKGVRIKRTAALATEASLPTD